MNRIVTSRALWACAAVLLVLNSCTREREFADDLDNQVTEASTPSPR